MIMVFALGVVDAQDVLQADDPEIQGKIESAMSAAPAGIAHNATILDRAFDSEGHFIVLREGTNGWSCLPDNPRSEVNDPICLDEMFMVWLYARRAGETPQITAPGFSYLLQGGETFSNSDPSATEPAEDYWVTTAPYMMILFPPGVDLSMYGSAPDHDLPFLMYPGTPYEHIMVPLGDMMDE